MEEKDVVDVFYQMTSALRYIHDRNVLHRDLKTANIFLTKEGMVKIGDFGISKMLTTRQGGAETVLGTPYYISPEMCEGKIYDEKSDIWALGCIVYEMACLQKTFEGSNLPALVNKIMRGQFAPIRGEYSPLFKQLVRDLLQRDPEFRPSASEILLSRLPDVQAQLEENQYNAYWEIEDIDPDGLTASTGPVVRQSRPPRSVLYYLKAFESTVSLTPVQLPPRSRILQVSVSGTHIIALTSEHLVFTWGEGRKGQLGHGEIESWRSRPHCVEALKEKSITRVGAGDGFSVFTSDNGIVMTCGDGSFGALGHGDWQGSSLPQLVKTLLQIDVKAIACGSEHVVVVGGQGDVYAWGRGEGGRLGLGHEDDCCSPNEVKIDTEKVFIINVKCSGNATMLLCDKGECYATGGNKYNRLGLDDVKITALLSTHVEKTATPTKVKALAKYVIVDLAMGPNHTVCLTNAGKILTFGRNSEAQLGRGHARHVAGPDVVKLMQEKEVTMVSCGSTFTMVGTNENVLYFWGTRLVSALTRPNTRDAFGHTFGQRLASPSATPLSETEVRIMLEQERLQTQSALEGSAAKIDDKSLATLNTTELLQSHEELTWRDVVLKPNEMLALYASQKQVEKGETVTLGSIQAQNQNIFLVVETTCPLARSTADGQQQDDPLDETPPSVMDFDDFEDEYEARREREARLEDEAQRDHGATTIPDWLKNDFDDAEEEDARRRPHSRRHKSAAAASRDHNRKRDKKRKNQQRAPMPSDLAEYQRKLEHDFNKKKLEIRMEAQNAVREREKALNEEVVRLREELDKQKERQQEILDAKAKAEREEKEKQEKEKSQGGGCILQ